MASGCLFDFEVVGKFKEKLIYKLGVETRCCGGFMNPRTWMVVVIFALSIVSCRTMELANKTIQINKSDDRAKVLQVMGTPQDRQFLADYEILQYCITGAGFGYHDYSAIWLQSGKVVGITTYKDHTPGSSCRGHFRTLRIEDAPANY